MQMHEVGKVVPEFARHPEGCHVGFDAGGISVVTFFNRPTDDEVSQFSEGSAIQLAVSHMRGVLLMLIKPGTLSWMDAPYNPLVGEAPPLPDIPDGQGLSCVLYLVDGISGTIRHMRLIGLPTKFSQVFVDVCRDMVARAMPIPEYNAALASIMRAYPTK